MKWSPEDTQWLKDNYYYKGTKLCAIHLNRTLQSITRKVAILGLTHISKNKTTESYIEELLLKDINIAPIEEYAGAHISILHEHLLCGHRWKARPTNILSGRGCPCCKAGISPVLPTLLYCAKATFGAIIFYKVGITNRSFEKRYSAAERLHLNLEWVVRYDTGAEAYKVEQDILQKYSEFKVNYGLLYSGNTECLSVLPNSPK